MLFFGIHSRLGKVKVPHKSRLSGCIHVFTCSNNGIETPSPTALFLTGEIIAQMEILQFPGDPEKLCYHFAKTPHWELFKSEE